MGFLRGVYNRAAGAAKKAVGAAKKAAGAAKKAAGAAKKGVKKAFRYADNVSAKYLKPIPVRGKERRFKDDVKDYFDIEKGLHKMTYDGAKHVAKKTVEAAKRMRKNPKETGRLVRDGLEFLGAGIGSPYTFSPSSVITGATRWRQKRIPMTDEMRRDQAFAEQAYAPLDSTGAYRENYHRQRAIQRRINANALTNGYLLDKKLSDAETKVFFNPTTKKVSVAYRGTVPTNRKDLVSDWHILVGTERKDKRFQESAKNFERIRDRYKGYDITTTGHSLGGQLSKYVSDAYPTAVSTNHAFSRGTGIREPFRKKDNRTVDISHGRDVISAMARAQGGKEAIDHSYKMSKLGAHDLGSLRVGG